MAEKALAVIPKIELHLHFEGSVGPELLQKIHVGLAKAGIEDVQALYGFSDFRGFLQAYKRVNEVLDDPGYFFHIARELAMRLGRQNVVYAEVIFTPLLHTRLGLDHDEVISNVLEGLEIARTDDRAAVRVNFIYDTVRQWGAEAAEQTVELALADRRKGLPVVGYGVGGDELSTPAAELAPSFRRARESGLGIFVHAGEVGEAAAVREAVEVLGAGRIGHGIAAVKDRRVMRLLAERGVALDVCLTSNELTGAVKSYAEHPWLELVEAGVPVTLGSDDPGFFGNWLTDELLRASAAWGLDTAFFADLMEKATAYSFLPDQEKEELARLLVKLSQTV